MFESSDSFHLTYFTFGTVESVDENLDVGSSQTWTAQAVCQVRVPSGAPVKIDWLLAVHPGHPVPAWSPSPCRSAPSPRGPTKTSPAVLPSWGGRRLGTQNIPKSSCFTSSMPEVN